MRRAFLLYKVEQKRQIQMLLMFAVSVLLAGVLSLSAGAGEAQAQDTFTCHKWASVNGSDANAGTQAAPYLRIASLIENLSDGETGCLKAGETFEEPAGEFAIEEAGGTQGNPITIRSSGTPRAKIKAAVHLKPLTHDIVFRDLDFVDSYVKKWDDSPYLAPDRSPMLNIQGDRIKLINNDLSFKRGHCVNAGNLNGEGGVATDPAEDFVLDGNRIHNCGTDLATFNESGGEHGVYLTYTTRARITNNYIYDNRVRGLQLYPKAEGTLVENNVLDGNSQNLNIGSYSGAGHFSRNTTVKNNIITNSTFQHPDDGAQVNGFYPAGTSDTQYSNIVQDNCLFPEYGGQETRPSKNFAGKGYSNYDNSFVDPLYKDRTNKDFTLAAGSPCAGKGPQSTGGNTAPEITNLSPTDGSTTTNRRPIMSATVRDAETDLQKSDVKIYVDGTLIPNDHYGYRPADDYLWREFEAEDPDFSYGSHTIRVVATDAQGVSTERSWNFEVTEATDTPTITSVKPTLGQSGVLRNTSPTATFSEEMKSDTITTSTVQLKQKQSYYVRKRLRNGKIRRVLTYRWVPVSASVSYDATTKTATLDPSSDLLANTTYWAVVNTGAKDKAGNALAQNYSWTFTTGSS